MLQVFDKVALIHPRLTQSGCRHLVSLRIFVFNLLTWHWKSIIDNGQLAVRKAWWCRRSWLPVLAVACGGHEASLFKRSSSDCLFVTYLLYGYNHAWYCSLCWNIFVYMCRCRMSSISELARFAGRCLRSSLVLSLLWRFKFEHGIFRDQDVTVRLMIIRGNNHTSLHLPM